MSDTKKTILVVDDDSDVRNILKLILESEGYSFAEADSAESGLKKYQEVKPDAVIVDLMMEKVDSGAGIVKELKLLGNSAPIFLLSAAGDTMIDSVDYAQVGFSGVFQKPVQKEQLLQVLKAKA